MKSRMPAMMASQMTMKRTVSQIEEPFDAGAAGIGALSVFIALNCSLIIRLTQGGDMFCRESLLACIIVLEMR